MVYCFYKHDRWVREWLKVKRRSAVSHKRLSKARTVFPFPALVYGGAAQRCPNVLAPHGVRDNAAWVHSANRHRPAAFQRIDIGSVDNRWAI